MGLFQLVAASKWFVELDDVKTIVPGQFVWCPALYLDPHPTVLEASRSVANSHASAQCKLVTMNDTHFTRRSRGALPVAPLKLKDTEEALLLKAKKRPGIVLSVSVKPAVANLATHQGESRLVVAPVYGVATDEYADGFRDPLWTRIRYLQHRHFFPMRAWSEKRPSTQLRDACSLKEGVVRLDRLQFVTASAPSCRPVPLRLGEELLDYLRNALSSYLSCATSQDFGDMVNLFAEELPASAR